MNCFCVSGRSTSFIPHIILPPFFLLPRCSMLFLAGDLAQMNLPVGMKDLNLRYTKVTGKATSE